MPQTFTGQDRIKNKCLFMPGQFLIICNIVPGQLSGTTHLPRSLDLPELAGSCTFLKLADISNLR